MNHFTLNALASQLNTAWVSSYQPESEAIFAAMVPTPGITRKGLIDDLIIAIKVGGVLPKLDCLEIFAAHSEQAGGINWAAPGGYVTGGLVGNASWKVDESFAGSVVGTSAISSGFAPSNGSKYTLAGGEMGFHLHKKPTLPSGASAKRPLMGSTDVGYLGGLTLAEHEALGGAWCQAYRKADNRITAAINCDAEAQTIMNVMHDDFMYSFTGYYSGGAYQRLTVWLGGDTGYLLDTNIAVPPAGLDRPTPAVALAAINFAGEFPAFPSDAEFSMYYAGSPLTIPQRQVLADAVATYMAGVAANPEYLPESSAIFSAMVPAPLPTTKQAVNTAMNSLVTAGYLPRMDRLGVMQKAENQQHGLLDWKAPAESLTMNGSAVWTQADGVVGSGAPGSNAATGYTPLADAVNYTQTSSSFFVYTKYRATYPSLGRLVGTGVIDGTETALFESTSGAYEIYVDGLHKYTSASVVGDGFICVTRPSADTIELYKNGVSIPLSGGGTCSTLTNRELKLISDNADEKVIAWGCGDYFTPAEQLDIKSIIDTYLAAM